jgi:Leucine-rich repeat (LRR) protein
MPEIRNSTTLAAMLLACAAGTAGCRSEKTPADDPKVTQVKPLPPTETTNPVQRLREKLKLNPGEGEIVVNERGKITGVYLERTHVSDISPLKGLPLEELYLSYTNVSDLSPLKGMPLKKLNVMGTRVTDIGVIESLSADGLTLWLNKTRVNDLSPLKGKSLESLDLSGTPVTDLSPLAGMKSLRRLNLQRSAVTDLTPLKGLRLQRIVFDPTKITQGLDAIREMDSLVHMHTQFQEKLDKWLGHKEFWKRADAGTLPKE